MTPGGRQHQPGTATGSVWSVRSKSALLSQDPGAAAEQREPEPMSRIVESHRLILRGQGEWCWRRTKRDMLVPAVVRESTGAEGRVAAQERVEQRRFGVEVLGPRRERGGEQDRGRDTPRPTRRSGVSRRPTAGTVRRQRSLPAAQQVEPTEQGAAGSVEVTRRRPGAEAIAQHVRPIIVTTTRANEEARIGAHQQFESKNVPLGSRDDHAPVADLGVDLESARPQVLPWVAWVTREEPPVHDEALCE